MSDSSSSLPRSNTAADGFDVVCVAIGEYQHGEDHPNLPADEEAVLLIELLSELGGEPDPWQPAGASRDRTEVDALLDHWARVERARSSMLFWVGHGSSDGNDVFLATYESRLGEGVAPEDLARHIWDEWGTRSADGGAWTIVGVEACGSKRFVQQLNAVLHYKPNVPERLVLVWSGSEGRGHLGEFRKALANALGSYTDNDEWIRLPDLVGRVGDHLHEGWVAQLAMHRARPIRRTRLLEGTVTAPVDIYTELRDFVRNLGPGERGHFLPKAQSAEQGELAWYFVGRGAERKKIAHWLRTRTSGMLIVTGPAGSGKSALLGNVLVHANPALRELLTQAGQLEPIPDEQRPPDKVFDAVVLLTGMTTGELVGRLADAAKLPPPPPTEEPRRGVEALLTGLAERPFCLMVDALDEAQEPASIASVLHRIAALPAGRVVIGTRRSTHEGPDLRDTTAEDLLDALGRAPSTVVVDVERDREAVATYVRRRLAGARDTGTVDVDDPTIERVVELIGAQQRQFLFARLAVHEILATPSLLEEKHSGELKRMVSNDHRALFAAAVDRLTHQAPANGALLEALALSEGRGLPRADRIWAIVASTLVGDIRNTDIDDLLRDAAAYVMLDAEDGQSVYRLAHQTFKEHLLAPYERRDAEPSLSDRHRLITRALISAAEQDLPAPPNPYLVHHLPAHVATAGAWSDLPASDLLDHLVPVDVIVQRARTLLNRRRPEAAEHGLRVALMRESQHTQAHAVLAIALSNQAKHAAALTEAKEAIRLAPDWWYPYYVAGHVLYRAHREALAARSARTALQIDPTVTATWILLARAHLATGEWWLSVQAARQGLTHDPHDSELVSIMTLALSEITGAPGAMANAAEAVRLGPTEPLAHFAYGSAALAIGDTRNAVSAFREALRLDPSMDSARAQLVETLKQRNPLYRNLFRAPKRINQLGIPRPLTFMIGLILPMKWFFIAIMHWALWATDALVTWRLSRDPYHRLLLPGYEVRGARLSALCLAGGAVMLAGGIALSHPGTGIAAAGLATLALVTPIEETFTTATQPVRRILGCWTASLAAAIAVLLGISLMPTTPDALGAYPVVVMLAALASIWVAAGIRSVFKRRHQGAALDPFAR